MKELVVISGKGGTGKTSITAALAYLAGKEAVIADCDVDAADMHLLLEPDMAHEETFISGKLAKIDPLKCIGCNICFDTCRFSAIIKGEETCSIDRISCEGCGYCARVCPHGAISMEDQAVGKFYISNTRFDNTLVHAKLGIGSENSGKLVAKVKIEAKRIAEETGTNYIIVDGSPGIGCPVVSSLSGADFVLLVTEPTLSGLHDLKRVFLLVEKFGIKSGCIINKADLNPEITVEIENFLSEKGIAYINKLSYDETFIKALVKGKTIMEVPESETGKRIAESWKKIRNTKTKK